VPVEPPPSTFAFPSVDSADEFGRVAFGGDLEPGTLLAAYRSGLFPMPHAGWLTWWSPDPRAILPVGALHVSHSLRRSVRRFEVTIDAAFEDVIDGCARRGDDEYDWITPDVLQAYVQLHELGWAHSVEAWDAGELAGGLYGVALGGLFAGESMFHRRRDASKVALVALVKALADADSADRIIDIQWLTPHLASLGAVELSRADYLARLERALTLATPSALGS
jgi:leucyl/phenylalanyl-tRNA--protein transferase